MTVRSVGKKIALGFAIFSVFCMLACVGLFVYFVAEKGWYDVMSASFMSASLFFASTATVLYFISKPPLYELLPWDAPTPEASADSGR